jgi:hypothetical protein
MRLVDELVGVLPIDSASDNFRKGWISLEIKLILSNNFPQQRTISFSDSSVFRGFDGSLRTNFKIWELRISSSFV